MNKTAHSVPPSLKKSAASTHEIVVTEYSSLTGLDIYAMGGHASAAIVEFDTAMGQMQATLEGINASSRKLADIIGVIDGIAFQTQALAVDAAMKAASAGEQGREFAAFASEMQSLAGLNADAAKEIKSLLYNSAAPTISHDVVQRFFNVATIRDEEAFAATLKEVVLGQIQLAGPTPTVDENADVRAQLSNKAAALKAQKTWTPTATDLQRGRAQMLREFNMPHNLPLVQFAALANKSRQQVYKDVAARRLLALTVGTRGQRIPDWQLDSNGLALTQQVLTKAAGVDEWTLFHALLEPLESFGGKSPVKLADKSNMHRVVSAVLSSLGVHAPCP